MRAARLENVRASVSVATTRCRSGRCGGPKMNRLEQVSSDHHQMSLQGGPQVWCPWEGVPYLIFPGR